MYKPKSRGAGNKGKSLTSRTGSTVTLDDSQGLGSILIKEPSGNTIFMDGAGNITITAPNKITINATDIELNGGNSINLNADASTQKGGKGTMTVNAKKSIDATAETNNISLTASAQEIKLTAQTNLSLEGKTNALLKKDDGNKILIAGSVTDIDGGQVQIN